MPFSFKYGLKRQVPDVRDAEFRLVAPWRSRLALPPSFYLPKFDWVPRLDQAQFNACGPNSFSESAAYDEVLQGLTQPKIPARMFVYYNARQLSGDVRSDDGVQNRDMFKAVAQFGYVYEDEYAYDEAHLLARPPKPLYDHALPLRSIVYQSVRLSDPQIRGILFSYHVPLTLGFEVFQQIESDQAAETGVVTDPPPGAIPIGGHDVTIYAYDAMGFGGRINGPAYKFRNHWVLPDGRLWGDNGNGYISAKYVTLTRYGSDCWGLNSVASKTGVSDLTKLQVVEFIASALGVKGKFDPFA